jgi:hypothetical protein
VLVGNAEGERSLGERRSGCKDNIKIVLKEIRSVGVDWICLAQDTDQWMALVNTVMNLRVYLFSIFSIS